MAGYIGSKSSVTLVDGYTEAEADAEFVTKTGDTMTGDLVVENSNGATINVNTGLAGAVSKVILHEGSTASPANGATLEYDGATNLFSIGVGSDISTKRLSIARDTGNVGIGTSSVNAKLDVRGTGVVDVGIGSTSAGGAYLYLDGDSNGDFSGSDYCYIGHDSSGQLTISQDSPSGSNNMIFNTAATERMRIDSSGNLLVGKTSFNHANAGAMLASDGRAYSTVDGNSTFTANRLSSDGEIIRIQKDTATVGSIGAYSGDLYVVNGGGVGAGLRYNSGFPNILPCNGTGADRDNAIDLGASGVRFDDIYATNGTIQTSDFNEKQDIASLTATEMLVGKRISTLFKTFRWKDSVAEKGDNARTHTGVIAQDVQSAFTAEGLDAGDYALFISSTWWETQTEVPAVEAVAEVEAVTETTTDEDGNEVVTVITEAVEAVEAVDAYTRTDTYETEAEAPEGATEKTRLGIRYPELLSFVAAYNEQRFASIEARLTALEA